MRLKEDLIIEYNGEVDVIPAGSLIKEDTLITEDILTEGLLDTLKTIGAGVLNTALRAGRGLIDVIAYIANSVQTGQSKSYSSRYGGSRGYDIDKGWSSYKDKNPKRANNIENKWEREQAKIKDFKLLPEETKDELKRSFLLASMSDNPEDAKGYQDFKKTLIQDIKSGKEKGKEQVEKGNTPVSDNEEAIGELQKVVDDAIDLPDEEDEERNEDLSKVDDVISQVSSKVKGALDHDETVPTDLSGQEEQEEPEEEPVAPGFETKTTEVAPGKTPVKPDQVIEKLTSDAGEALKELGLTNKRSIQKAIKYSRNALQGKIEDKNAGKFSHFTGEEQPRDKEKLWKQLMSAINSYAIVEDFEYYLSLLD